MKDRKLPASFWIHPTEMEDLVSLSDANVGDAALNRQLISLDASRWHKTLRSAAAAQVAAVNMFSMSSFLPYSNPASYQNAMFEMWNPSGAQISSSLSPQLSLSSQMMPNVGHFW